MADLVPLKVVVPVTVNDANFGAAASNVPETDAPAWNAATAYVVGDLVIRTTPNIHSVYKRAVGGTTATPPESDTTNWTRIGPTNRWAMFDQVNGTQTSNANSIIFECTPADVVTAIAFLNVVASSIRVQMIDPTYGTVYDKTVNLVDNGTINTWLAYFFTPIKRATGLVLVDLPSFRTAKVRVTISAPSSTAACGTCVFGRQQEIGNGIEIGDSVGIQSYSRKERDAFGNFVLVKRSYSDWAKFNVSIEPDQSAAVKALITSLRDTLCLWIGDPDYPHTIIYGFPKDFSIVFPYHTLHKCSLEIEGIT